MASAASEFEMRMQREEEAFQMNVDAIAGLLADVEDEIAQLEAQKRSLMEVRDGQREHKAAPLLEECAAVSEEYLAKLRAVRANNDLAAAGAVGTDGKPLKTRKEPDFKLMHRLTIDLKPAPLTPIPGLFLEGGHPSGSTTPAPSSAGDAPAAHHAAKEKDKKKDKKKEGGLGGFLSSIKAKLQTDADKERERVQAALNAAAEADQEAQAVLRCGVRLEQLRGVRLRPTSSGNGSSWPQPSSADEFTEPVEVASVSFVLRSLPRSPGAAPPLGPGDADELAAYVNMSIHNAVAVATTAAERSHVKEELARTSVGQRLEANARQTLESVKAEQEAARRLLDAVMIDVTAEPVEAPANSTAGTAFFMTVIVKHRPTIGLEATIAKIMASEEYRLRRATVEKAFAVLEAFAVSNFSASVEAGVAARPPPMECPTERASLLETRRGEAIGKVRSLWNKHKDLLAAEAEVVAAVKQTAEQLGAQRTHKEQIAAEKLQALITAIQPPVMAAIDNGILPAVHRAVCPQTADPEPLATASVAANLYHVSVRRAPRDIVKLVLNEVYDAAARAESNARSARSHHMATSTGADPLHPSASQSAGPAVAGTAVAASAGDPQQAPVGKGAAVRLAAAKAKVSAALAVYDDLHFDIVPFPYKSANQKKRAAILLRRAQVNTAQAVGHVCEKVTALVSAFMAESKVASAIQEAEGQADTALRDAASVIAAVLRAVNTLTGPAAKGSRQLSRDTGRYDVVLCACEASAPLTARVVVKPPPSSQPGVEPVRVSHTLGIHPAPAKQRRFTGRVDGNPCRCDVFNVPLQLMLAEVASKACDAAEQHSPFRDRFEAAAAAAPEQS